MLCIVQHLCMVRNVLWSPAAPILTPWSHHPAPKKILPATAPSCTFEFASTYFQLKIIYDLMTPTAYSRHKIPSNCTHDYIWKREANDIWPFDLSCWASRKWCVLWGSYSVSIPRLSVHPPPHTHSNPLLPSAPGSSNQSSKVSSSQLAWLCTAQLPVHRDEFMSLFELDFFFITQFSF